MQKTISFLLIATLLTSAYAACGDGFFATVGTRPDSTKGECTPCHPLCKTCSNAGSCDTFQDKVKGIDRQNSNALLCTGTSLTGSSIGYNTNNDSCDKCFDGCESCMIDYNYCMTCKTGWDFDQNGLQCIRATLGLAAVVLALSVLTLLFVIITCICACKL